MDLRVTRFLDLDVSDLFDMALLLVKSCSNQLSIGFAIETELLHGIVTGIEIVSVDEDCVA